MNPKILLAALWIQAFVWAQPNVPQNTLRIAMAPPTDYDMALDDALLERARKNGYNYILGTFFVWRGHVSADKEVTAQFVSDLKNAFEQVDAHGMRLIPSFQFGNRHATEQTLSFADLTPGILWNIVGRGPCAGAGRVRCRGGIVVYPPNDTDTVNYINHVHSFTPDPPGLRGTDFIFKQVLLGIQSAFNSANLSYSTLEYVHIGHDELLGGWGRWPHEKDTVKLHVTDDTLVVGNSASDSAFLHDKLQGPPPLQGQTEAAIQELLAGELERRILQADTVFGSSTRLMVWSDMYDPQGIGGHPWPQLYNGHKVRTSGTITKISSGLRSRLIMGPWMYTTGFPYSSNPSDSGYNDYNADSTFNFFKSNGYAFVYGALAGDDHISNKPFGSDNFAGAKQLGEYVSTALKPEFRDHALGHVSTAWIRYASGPTPAPGEIWARHSPPWTFRTLEFLSNWSVYHASIFN